MCSIYIIIDMILIDIFDLSFFPIQPMQPLYQAPTHFTATPPTIVSPNAGARSPARPKYRKNNNGCSQICSLCLPCVCVCVIVLVAVIWAILNALVTDNFTLSGYVLNESTNQFVPHVRIVLVDHNKRNKTFETLSNDYGQYSIPMLPKTAYDVYITNTDYQDYHEFLDLTSFSSNIKNFIITPL
ncbi:hypothetical protein RCL1_001852 [Eukaryota sp. TZLM3-RCL]